MAIHFSIAERERKMREKEAINQKIAAKILADEVRFIFLFN